MSYWSVDHETEYLLNIC